jgi:Amt family ammonium transporter
MRILLTTLLLCGLPSGAFALDGAVATVQHNLDHDWVMTAAALVLLMQMGFLLLEAGFVRTKNTINVAQKNIADLMFSVAAFWLVGFSLMFGVSQGGWFGWSPDFAMLSDGTDWHFTFFVFQAMFCGTAATIVSGAVAERLTFNTYLVATGLISVVIYPVFGHWAWGGGLIAGNTAWLGDMGFVDFAGSTVVHSIGAWVALALIILIGPRAGRFDADGAPIRIQGHSPVLGGAGAIMLFVGWIGFNGGSTVAATPEIAPIVLNTVVAAVFGGVVGIVFAKLYDGFLAPDRSVNGMLGGLVAITAGCSTLDASWAAVMGMVGGMVALAGNEILLRVFRLDDVVGAVSVHGLAGATGTLMLAFMADPALLPAGSAFAQFKIQLIGVATAFAIAFIPTTLVCLAVRPFMRLRITGEEEAQGLNRVEHGATLGTGNLQLVIAELLRGEADFSTRIPAEPGDEAAELTELFNRLLAHLHNESNAVQLRDEARRKALEDSQLADQAVVAEIAALIERAADGDLSGRVNVGAKVGALRSVSAGVNQLFDAMDEVTGELKGALRRFADGDLGARMRTGRGGAFAHIAGAVADTGDRLSGAMSTISEAAGALDASSRDLTASAGELDALAQAQREGVEAASLSMDEARESLSQSVTAAGDATARTREVASVSAEARTESEGATRRMEEVREAMARAGAFVETIESIARQTNLLAINAAVEAMRAGEAGRSFIVVAEEVRSLSLRVTESSRQIASIIDASARLVGDAGESVAGIRDRLSRIGENAAETSAVVQDVAERLLSDARRVEQINITMGEMRDGASRSTELSDATHQTADSLGRSSSELAELVARFHRAPKGRASEAA